MNTKHLTQKIGDTKKHTIPMEWEGQSFVPGDDWQLVCTVKADPRSQTDEQRLFQKSSNGYGITVNGSTALVSVLRADTYREADEESEPATAEFEATPGTYYLDIQATRIIEGDGEPIGTVRTVAEGQLTLTRDVTRLSAPSGTIYTEEDPALVTKGDKGDKGDTGNAATITLGSVSTGAAGSSVSITNSGAPGAAVFNFSIPRGDKGETGSTGPIGPANELSVAEVTTGAAGSNASVTIGGTAPNQTISFAIPRGDTGATGGTGLKGDKGDTGNAATITLGSVSTGAAGSSVSITNSGAPGAAVFNFSIPRGDKGETGSTGPIGPATQLSVASTTTGAAGSNASVAISGTAPNQSLAFTIPTGPQGPQGPTGSSGATASLTGYVSGAGTVAATDTVIQAVGKLNGNDELKAPIASLYPYIGGKLLTYLDEEAAIADPLISAGDIYRKTAGGVDYVNPDNVPSLDLRFATDKTLTARRGPTPTFSRASGATYIGSDGLIHGIDTSTTSNSISAASKTFTLDATAGQDQLWRTGDAVEASNGSNFMVGTVTSYNAATQSLVCNMTSIGGSGTFTSWRIGYRGPRFDHDPVSRTNLAADSNSFNNWGKSNSTVATSSVATPEGTADAWKVVEDNLSANHSATRSFTPVSGTTYTASVWLKSAENGFAFVGFVGGGFVSTFISVDLSTGAVSTAPAAGTPIGASSVSHSNGWWRVSFSSAATASLLSNIDIRLSRDGNWANRSYLGNGVNGMYVYGAQVEAGSTATSYIPTTTAPVTIRDCRGLLIEEGRTNLTVKSDDFGAGEWNQAAQRNLTVTANNTASPSGATDADLLTVGATTTTYQVVQALPATGNITSGTAYTVSCFFKAKEVTRVNIHAGNQVTFPADAIFDLTGVGSIIGTPTGTASIQQYPNGWYRCIITATAGATSNTSFRISPVSGTSRTYAGNSVDSFWAWGAQLEAGAFPTSFIPTTTGSVVRSADVCNITGANFTSFYNQSEGTFLSNWSDFSPVNANNWPIPITTNSNFIARSNGYSAYNPSSPGAVAMTGGNLVSLEAHYSRIRDILIKQASAYSGSGMAISVNGLAVRTNPALFATNQTFLKLHGYDAGSQFNGHFAAIRYYKKRLPNAKLAQLTA